MAKFKEALDRSLSRPPPPDNDGAGGLERSKSTRQPPTAVVVQANLQARSRSLGRKGRDGVAVTVQTLYC